MKNILRENMLRFGTKNLIKLNEQYNPDRETYYDQMTAGELPDVDLTYKLDSAWFDNHTDSSLFDMATGGSGWNQKQLAYALYIVRTGTKGVNPKTKTFKGLTDPEKQKAPRITNSDGEDMDMALRKLAGIPSRGTGAPE